MTDECNHTEFQMLITMDDSVEHHCLKCTLEMIKRMDPSSHRMPDNDHMTKLSKLFGSLHQVIVMSCLQGARDMSLSLLDQRRSVASYLRRQTKLLSGQMNGNNDDKR